MKVLFATTELAPFIKVGGLADASAGLVAALRSRGVEVEVAIPDYGDLPLHERSDHLLPTPAWAGPIRARRGSLDGFESVTLIDAPRLRRPHPYLDSEGQGWPDNDIRFLSFSVAVAAMTTHLKPDVLHLNDWHTGASLGFMERPPPSVLTIHNMAYQGVSDGSLLGLLARRPEAYEWYGGINPLTGAIALADWIVTVSPTYAAETLRPEMGFGLDGPLRARGERFIGILNGIDTEVWNPATDPYLDIHFDQAKVSRKREIGRRLVAELGWDAHPGPLIGMVTRLTDQKGVDLALLAAESLPELGARMVLLGSGERRLADAASRLARRMGDRFAFRQAYDERLAHRIFAGSDLYLMPSRFEPAGLTQMQAMRYGTIPVVTDVGGLHDTVVDDDVDPRRGTGFVAQGPTASAVAVALARAVRAWRSTQRRGAIRARGMSKDWSWSAPAQRYHELYEELATSVSTGAR